LAQSSSSTPEQLIYRLAQSRGITPLCGTTNDSHMREALAAQDIEWEESSDVIKLAAFMAA
jgi:aryl-alcohol dehydrogenase-like predicted oxidoreductase